ncbi:PREDICTED: uncharacterized protein LOC109592060 [Amphimedon queenslandica]|uniref:Uncharacterized protein n=1 Tax=Amphimedon queenslandica TaxID=400682 RepID=A0AAN0K105_AMPQE|nr:PREDICTED: uncharacterized protein LOC109592060 [Amphimedon queenslandica]|eukprot:XP_019863190.1 PREDICTED: uncharacterized protein LOC109592060 [Amphimedon queenslandica]
MENTALIPVPPISVDDDDEENPQIIQNENDSRSSNSREPLVFTQPQFTHDFHLIYCRNQSPSDNFLMLAIIQLFLCSLIGVLALFCIIPALYFAVKARNAEMNGDIIRMYSKRQLALIFNFLGFFVGFINIIVNIYIINLLVSLSRYQ